ncbi:MAG: hypothetical protein OEM99_02955 [Gammaproteobacteria bacterium]|nr:hypothetical protein [Gammaproteobacteria bacterium]
MGFDDFLKLLRDTGNALYNAFAWPGEYALLQLGNLAPDFAAYMSTPANHTTAVVVLSLIYWYLVIVLATIFVRACRDVARIVTAAARTIAFRIILEAGNAKTRIICRLRQRLPWRKAAQDVAAPTVEFDKLDLAILKTAVVKGPGFALSAPELAEQFSLRPAQIQRSLDKLCSNAMMTTVIGSTEGFDNYRLTDSGSAFVGLWARRKPRAVDNSAMSNSRVPLG